MHWTMPIEPDEPRPATHGIGPNGTVPGRVPMRVSSIDCRPEHARESHERIMPRA